MLAQTLSTLQQLADAASSAQGGQPAPELHALLRDLMAEVIEGQDGAGDGGIASAGRWLIAAVEIRSLYNFVANSFANPRQGC